MITPFEKDPGAVLDYVLDWSTYLGVDVIKGSQWFADSGITVESDSFDDTSTTVWVSGGTVDKRYALTNRISTDERTDDWTIYLLVMEH